MGCFSCQELRFSAMKRPLSAIAKLEWNLLLNVIKRRYNRYRLQQDTIMSNSDNSNSSAELKGKIDAFRVKCRKAGLKITPQRIAVYKALIQSKEHPSAETVFRRVRKEIPNISLDTVNRTLLTLAEIGAAFIVEGSGDAKRFDGGLENHQHFRCIKCKRIIDFHHEPFDNIAVPKNISRKYIVLRKTVYLEGICDLCREHINK
jgi:Fur family peroxide stress response transcriptional regulator